MSAAKRITVHLSPMEAHALFNAASNAVGEARVQGEYAKAMNRAAFKLEAELIARDLPTHDEWVRP